MVGVACAVVVGVTAAAATTAYRAGRAAGGRDGGGGRPALRILDIGCCAKLGFGGGLDAKITVSRGTSDDSPERTIRCY